MSPQDLLKETQRAAGDTRLTEWHQTLIDAGKECRSMNEVPADLLILSCSMF